MIKTGTFFHHIRQAAEERGESLEQTFEYVHELGYVGAEVDADDHEGAELLGSHDIAVSSIYRNYAWQDSLDESLMEEHIRLAKYLGTDKIMAIPGFFGEGDSESIRREKRKRMAEGMNRLYELASQNGLVLTIEDYDNALSPIATIDGMEYFLAAVPGLKVAFDTGNFKYSGEDVLTAEKVFADRIVHVHFKDRLYSRNGSGDPCKCPDGSVLWPCAVGEGDIPMEEILRRLKRNGYSGYVMAEFFGAASYSDTLKRSMEFLRERV
ncbi:MAG: sugar phosphate isomerase/epimerase [Lachnospiraceae bacterium]|nr:sugar phosphate isomerase/epimerase [Lachnospiraceae bacterium]